MKYNNQRPEQIIDNLFLELLSSSAETVYKWNVRKEMDLHFFLGQRRRNQLIDLGSFRGCVHQVQRVLVWK